MQKSLRFRSFIFWRQNPFRSPLRFVTLRIKHNYECQPYKIRICYFYTLSLLSPFVYVWLCAFLRLLILVLGWFSSVFVIGSKNKSNFKNSIQRNERNLFSTNTLIGQQFLNRNRVRVINIQLHKVAAFVCGGCGFKGDD